MRRRRPTRCAPAPGPANPSNPDAGLPIAGHYTVLLHRRTCRQRGRPAAWPRQTLIDGGIALGRGRYLWAVASPLASWAGILLYAQDGGAFPVSMPGHGPRIEVRKMPPPFAPLHPALLCRPWVVTYLRSRQNDATVSPLGSCSEIRLRHFASAPAPRTFIPSDGHRK